jgi:hypothetical protein
VNKFATKVLLILNILSAAALLLSYLAPLVDPAKLGVACPFWSRLSIYPPGKPDIHLFLAYTMEKGSIPVSGNNFIGVESPQ